MVTQFGNISVEDLFSLNNFITLQQLVAMTHDCIDVYLVRLYLY